MLSHFQYIDHRTCPGLAPSPLKIVLHVFGSALCTPSNTWFLEWFLGISIGSAVFARVKFVTDKQTDRPTDQRQTERVNLSVAIGCMSCSQCCDAAYISKLLHFATIL